MSLTRSMLKDLQLPEEAVERIIAAHIETVDALKRERDEARAAAEALPKTSRERDELRNQLSAATESARQAQDALTAYQEEAAAAKRQQARSEALRQALLDQGANEQAVQLLADALPLSEDCWDGDALRDPEAAIAPIRARYGGFFSVPTPLPTTRVTPPLHDGPALSREDVQRMSLDEINHQWSLVRSILAKGE